MEIRRLINRIAGENTYLLSNSSFSFVIDPGSEPERIVEELRAIGKPLAGIFLSHAHFDHIMGLDRLLEAYPETLVLLDEHESDWLQRPELNASRLMLGQDLLSAAETEPYIIEAPYLFGETEFRVCYTPGHSIGGVSLIFDKEKSIFTGDALFKQSIGRTDLPTGNYEQLLGSIENELLSLPDDYRVLPGHGEETTIGAEREFNPFLKA